MPPPRTPSTHPRKRLLLPRPQRLRPEQSFFLPVGEEGRAVDGFERFATSVGDEDGGVEERVRVQVEGEDGSGEKEGGVEEDVGDCG